MLKRFTAMGAELKGGEMQRVMIVFLIPCFVCCGSAFSGQEVAKGANGTGGNATLSSVSVSVPGGNSLTGTVTLDNPAPENGAEISLKSSDPSAATLPASVKVAARATTATFTITTGQPARNTSVTISASYNNVTKTATLIVAQAWTRGEWTKGELFRGIFGFEQAGASSTQSKQSYFADVYLSTPFPWKTVGHNDVIGSRGRVWGYFRTSSIPQQVNSSSSQFVSEFAQNASKIKINELARSAEFRAGFEVMFATLGMK